MCEEYIRVHRVNESSTIAMCFVPENIVALRGKGNDEEEGLEEKRTRSISGADGNEHVQRLVEEYAAFYVWSLFEMYSGLAYRDARCSTTQSLGSSLATLTTTQGVPSFSKRYQLYYSIFTLSPGSDNSVTAPGSKAPLISRPPQWCPASTADHFSACDDIIAIMLRCPHIS